VGRSGEQLVALLHRAGKALVSGEDLSEQLGVSRTAVWKQVAGLRSRGYLIEAVPGQGYRFLASPDNLSPGAITSGIATELVGREIVVYDQVGSTNTEAFRLAEGGAVEGTVVLADYQSGGKGRLGRSWESPAGVNIYCSIILRPPILPVNAPQLTFISSLAVCRAIEAVATLQPSIKWPNDIYVGGSKVAGLLNEMSAEMEKVNFIILGIGVNVNMTAEQFPEGLRHPATSLCIETGRPLARLLVIQSLLTALDDLYLQYRSEGADPILRQWEQRSLVHGRRVRVMYQDSSVQGVAVGIDGTGALLVMGDDGVVERVLAGDVALED
jgi:BirA family biotin operon repressor/biotin-[acetyl-CoA-carboxylase] ligase